MKIEDQCCDPAETCGRIAQHESLVVLEDLAEDGVGGQIEESAPYVRHHQNYGLSNSPLSDSAGWVCAAVEARNRRKV